MAERVMQGQNHEPDAPEPAADGPVAADPLVEGQAADRPRTDDPQTDDPLTGAPAFSDAADGGPQGVEPRDPLESNRVEDPDPTTETHVMPAVDESSDREPAIEETQVIPADESTADETRVIPADESAAEETRVIPSQHGRDAEEPAAERTAVLPPQEDAAFDEEPRPTPRTDHAGDDTPRSRTDRPAGQDAQPAAAGPAVAGGAAAGGVAAGTAAADDDHADRDAASSKPAKPPRTTDRPLGALALFVLRLVTAGIFGVHGVQKLLDIPGTREFFGSFPLPQAELFGLITAAGELAVALGLLLGLAVRIAGLGAMAIAIGALILVHWTEWPIAGSPAGFSGELELLLAAVGFVFFLLGGGRIGLDRMFRKNP
ncbi:MAG: DoxX family membrane protein [Propionibacteriaceae bacterium]